MAQRHRSYLRAFPTFVPDIQPHTQIIHRGGTTVNPPKKTNGAEPPERNGSALYFVYWKRARATEQAALFLRCIHPLRFDERKDLYEECTRYDAFLKEERKDTVGKEHCTHGTADSNAGGLAAR